MRAAAEAVEEGVGLASYGDPVYLPDVRSVRFLDRAAGHLQDAIRAYARGDDLDPENWRTPLFGDPENDQPLELQIPKLSGDP